jgi:hypothetical protein
MYASIFASFHDHENHRLRRSIRRRIRSRPRILIEHSQQELAASERKYKEGFEIALIFLLVYPIIYSTVNTTLSV